MLRHRQPHCWQASVETLALLFFVFCCFCRQKIYYSATSPWLASISSTGFFLCLLSRDFVWLRRWTLSWKISVKPTLVCDATGCDDLKIVQLFLCHCRSPNFKEFLHSSTDIVTSKRVFLFDCQCFSLAVDVCAGDNEADGDDGSELGLCNDAGEEACATSRHPPLCWTGDTIRRPQKYQPCRPEKVLDRLWYSCLAFTC